MYEDRLERLAVLLEKDAHKPDGVKFDLASWAEPSVAGNYRRWESKDVHIPVDCGTTACALGLAVISGEFAKEGLTTSFYGDDSGFLMFPSCNEQEGFYAGAELFGIEYDDSRYLFDPDCYDEVPQGAKGELFVAQRIRDFINGTIEHDQHPNFEKDDYED